jgi:hypothetical protein
MGISRERRHRMGRESRAAGLLVSALLACACGPPTDAVPPAATPPAATRAPARELQSLDPPPPDPQPLDPQPPGRGQAPTYSAWLFIGGLDRLSISKTDLVEGECATVLLQTFGGKAAAFPIDTPQSDFVVVEGVLSDCTGERAKADGGSGRIRWDPTRDLPCVLDVDVALFFGTGDARRVVRLKADGLAVDHSGCP